MLAGNRFVVVRDIQKSISEIIMRSIFSILPLVALLAGSAEAATDQECQSLWKTLDVNANGALEATEDTRGYSAAMQKSGVHLANPSVVSRDEFLGYCKTSIANVDISSPANTKDFGKGDITPSKNPLAMDDAKKKLEASGFKNVSGLSLDDKGVWHATAEADGKAKKVTIDAQGDIVGQLSTQPTSSSQPAMSAVGTVPKSGLYLWLFLLVGNFIALLALNRTGAATSAMSQSNLTYADRH
jgi:hypothetical protein